MQLIYTAGAAAVFGIVVPTVSANVTLNSMSRSVYGGSVFSSPGPFMEGRSGVEHITTPAYQNGTATWTATQTSNISTGGISFDSFVSVSLSQTPPQASFQADTSLQLVFTVSSPQEVSYQWDYVPTLVRPRLSGPGIGTLMLTDDGQLRSITLQPGQYTFFAWHPVLAVNFAPPQYITQRGTFSFVPAPSTVALVFVPATCFGALRRSRALRSYEQAGSPTSPIRRE